MRWFLFLLLIFFLICCKTIDYSNSNKRSQAIIYNEWKDLQVIKPILFETDTLLNFKTVKEIKSLLGDPSESRIVSYNYPSMNILWILEGPLEGIKSYSPVLMMEWLITQRALKRVVLFIEKNGDWISICNVLYDDGLEF